jgi:hypothetical protein
MREVYQFVQIRGKKLVLRGLGGLSAKSATLLRVSVQPPPARRIAFVLLGAAAGPEPRKQFAVLRSRMFGSFGHAPVSAVEVLTSATLPEPAAIAIVPIASGVGNDAPLLPPEVS